MFSSCVLCAESLSSAAFVPIIQTSTGKCPLEYGSEVGPHLDLDYVISAHLGRRYSWCPNQEADAVLKGGIMN